MLKIEVEYKKHDKSSNKSNALGPTPIIENIKAMSQAMSAVHGFMAGTDSNEWLLLAEKKAYEFIKDGNKNRG